MDYRRQLGDQLAVAFQCPFGAGIVTWPTMRVYDSTGALVESVQLVGWPIRRDKPFGNFGVFTVYLQGLYSVGKYSIFCKAVMSTGTKKEAHQLEILPGGSADGNVIASHFNGLPEANGVMYQLDNGTLNRKSNPR